MLFSNYVALEISGSEIRAVAVSLGRIKKWASAPLPPEAVKGGMVRDPQTLGVLIDSLFRIYRLPRERVIASVTGLPFIYRTVNMPAGQRIAAEAIDRESRREMAVSREEMYVSWQLTEKRNQAGENEYFAVGIPRQSLNPLIEALSMAGIKPYSIDIRPLALARMAARNEALIVSIDEDYVDIVVAAGGMVRVIHSFSLNEKAGAGRNLASEISAGLNRAVKALERDFPRLNLSPDAPVLFTATGGSDDSLPQRIGQLSGRPVELLSMRPSTPAGMPSGAYDAALGMLSKMRTSARGLPDQPAGAAGAGFHDINIDLYDGFKRVHPSRFQMVFVAAAAISLVLAGLVFLSFYMNNQAALEVAALQEEASKVSHSLSLAQTQNQAALAARLDAQNRALSVSRQLEDINNFSQSIAARRPDYAARLAFISSALPPGAAFKSIDFDAGKIRVNGSAQNGFDVLTLVSSLEESPYFNTVRMEQISPDQAAGVDFLLTIASETTVVDLSSGQVR